jgi:gamma-polyglutamate synthase
MTVDECRLNRHLILRTAAAYRAYRRRVADEQQRALRSVPRRSRKRWRSDFLPDRRHPQHALVRNLLDFLRLEIHESTERLERLAAANAEFHKALARVADRRELNRVLLDYASDFAPSWWQRWGDRGATNRWLDQEALQDRYIRARGDLQLYLIYLLRRLGLVASKLLPLVHRTDGLFEFWDRIGLNGLLHHVIHRCPDVRVHQAALQCLEMACRPLAPEWVSECVSEELQSYVQRIAMESNRDVWLQVNSLRVMHKVARDQFRKLVVRRLREPGEGDDLFVRRACVRFLAEYPELFALASEAIWDTVVADPSDAVRQQAAETLWGLPSHLADARLKLLASQDRAVPVRARAILGALTARRSPERSAWALKLLAECLDDERESFVLRVAIHVASEWLEDSETVSGTVRLLFDERIVPALGRLQATYERIPVRRAAAAARERIWLQSNPAARQLAQQLAPIVARLEPGRSRHVPGKWLQGLDRDLIGRTLAVMTQNDFGLELIETWSGYRLACAPHFGLRCWRVWHEFWRPATDKRQAQRHTIGRHCRGRVRAPSRVLGELSETKVPGEPLVVAEDGTWRPFLPLPDDIVSALNQSWLMPRPIRIYSSEGVTEIQASWNPWSRLCAAWELVRKLPKLAALRNWSSRGSDPPQQYVAELRRRGFSVTFRSHEAAQQLKSDSSVSQFFPALVAFIGPSTFPMLWNVLADYVHYFGSAFENTLEQLVLFAAAALLLLVVKHAFDSLRISRARRSIPLVIGGWGTRGKSGTERLKAALFNALGHPLLSKTTGCEAMFIMADALGESREIPLYRPNDKATIWEHGNLLRFAKRLRPSVFLWECMALSPEYVDVLQHQWTRDDLATITNTYPDHEDLQGPSGYDVSQTIAGFLPRRAHVITTEQQMLPVLRRRADRSRTTLEPVSWIESGLLTDDLLERFPYREHTDNIALVTTLAKRFGCDPDFAVKAMADSLVPDLGVLKTHPTARVRHAWIEFTNGMSANERFACLGNWERLGFDAHDAEEQPEVWLSSVINNRADRVARSRVFAEIVVNELAADRHFLIGSNLKGLQGFVWESWERYERQVRLWDEGQRCDTDRALHRLAGYARRFRVPTSYEQLRERVLPMLADLATTSPSLQSERTRIALADNLLACRDSMANLLRSQSVDEPLAVRIERDVTRIRQCYEEYERLRVELSGISKSQELSPIETQLRQTLRTWFERKLVVIEAYEAIGNEVISRIVDETPVGYTNRVMGMQNIKGTGLDFVYRFHAWDACERACRQLESSDSELRRRGLETLTQLPDFGVLGKSRVEQAVRAADRLNPPLDAELQVMLETVRIKLQGHATDLADLESMNTSTSRYPHWLKPLIQTWRQWSEVSDSVRRRQLADQIYRDLQHQRIGRQRAVDQLRQLKPLQ